MNTCPCSCGETKAHRVAKRVTADGTHVILWSDGGVTGLMGLKLPGVPNVRPQTEESAHRAVDAGWLFMSWVELYDTGEIGGLYDACRRGASGGRPQWKAARPLHLDWTVLRADRDGKPTCRVASLPRLRWPGMAIWHESGRYELVYESSKRDGFYAAAVAPRVAPSLRSTGFVFGTLRETLAHLREN